MILSISQSFDNGIVRRLWSPFRVEKQWTGLLVPGIGISDPPDGHPHAVFHMEAGFGNVGIVVFTGLLNVRLCDCALGRSGAQHLHCGSDTSALSWFQMCLRPNSVNWYVLGAPFSNKTSHGLRLFVVCRVQAIMSDAFDDRINLLVVVNVQLGLGIRVPRFFKCNPHKILAQDSEKHTVPETAILVENLVQHILFH